MAVDEQLVTVTIWSANKFDPKMPSPGQIVKINKFLRGQVVLDKAVQLTTTLNDLETV